jgi:hypothetical protein
LVLNFLCLYKPVLLRPEKLVALPKVNPATQLPRRLPVRQSLQSQLLAELQSEALL